MDALTRLKELHLEAAAHPGAGSTVSVEEARFLGPYALLAGPLLALWEATRDNPAEVPAILEVLEGQAERIVGDR